MYSLYIKPEADKIFKRLSKKNKKQFGIIGKKIAEIRQNPYHRYKSLKKPLHSFKRAHIDTNFVLIFKIDHESRTVDIYYFGHHDNVYQWRPKSQPS